MARRLDDLARLAASGVPRREVFKHAAVGLGATLLAVLPGSALAAGRRPERPANHPSRTANQDSGVTVQCIEFCLKSFPKGSMREQCVKDAVRKTGVCYQCGPASTSGEVLCGGVCVNPSSDNNNCGSCGNICPTGDTCTNGTCVASTCTTSFQCGSSQFCNTDVFCSEFNRSACICSSPIEGGPILCNNWCLSCGSNTCSSSSDCVAQMGQGAACFATCCGNMCFPPCSSTAPLSTLPVGTARRDPAHPA